MTDPMKERLAQLRAYSASVHRRVGLYSDVTKLADNQTSESLSALRRAPSPGKKIKRAGFIMLWVPEPTGITIALGAPMILAGRYLEKKYNGATISDIGSNTNSMVSSMHDIKNSL